MPLVSVIIPVYNAEKRLPACMDSVLGQDFRDIEVILVNDGSRDGSLALCRRYAELDARVRVIDQANAGLAPRATRLSAASATSIIDGDDVLPGATGALVRPSRHDLAILISSSDGEASDRRLIREPQPGAPACLTR